MAGRTQARTHRVRVGLEVEARDGDRRDRPGQREDKERHRLRQKDSGNTAERQCLRQKDSGSTAERQCLIAGPTGRARRAWPRRCRPAPDSSRGTAPGTATACAAGGAVVEGRGRREQFRTPDQSEKRADRQRADAAELALQARGVRLWPRLVAQAAVGPQAADTLRKPTFRKNGVPVAFSEAEAAASRTSASSPIVLSHSGHFWPPPPPPPPVASGSPS
eukprot:SAG22_NODE_250_length_13779_cov_6.413450_12_plen_220_part_00